MLVKNAYKSLSLQPRQPMAPEERCALRMHVVPYVIQRGSDRYNVMPYVITRPTRPGQSTTPPQAVPAPRMAPAHRTSGPAILPPIRFTLKHVRQFLADSNLQRSTGSSQDDATMPQVVKPAEDDDFVDPCTIDVDDDWFSSEKQHQSVQAPSLPRPQPQPSPPTGLTAWQQESVNLYNRRVGVVEPRTWPNRV